MKAIAKEMMTSPRKNRIVAASRNVQVPVEDQLGRILTIVKAIRAGDFSMRFSIEDDSLISEIGEVLNDINDMNLTKTNELVRAVLEVSNQGRLGGRR